MSFTPPSLPPISTLSAALENENDPAMLIAPELMGEEGAPPTIKRRSSHSDNEGGGQGDGTPRGISSSNGYQSSSARDERSGWGGNNNNNNGSNYTSGVGRHSHHHPWEEGYRDHNDASSEQQQHEGISSEYTSLHPQHTGDIDMDPSISNNNKDENGNSNINEENNNNDGNSDKPKPRKRARVSKPRQSKDNRNGGLKDDGLPEDGILDFADPSGNFKLGPVYVHPPKGAAQACVRCHKIKRKCDNAKPRCAGCNKADVACVFELSPATASFVNSLKSDNIALTSQIASAAERIQHLESAISNLERGLPPPPERDMYGDDNNNEQFANQLSTQADFAAMSRTILSVRSNDISNPVFMDSAPFDSLSSANERHELVPGSTTRSSFGINLQQGNQHHANPLPPYDVALQAVETFFMMNAISYPFLDRDEFLRDMDEIFRQEQSGGLRRGSTYDMTGHQVNEDAEHWARKEFILFMVVAIGTTNRERIGEAEKGSSKVYKERAFMSLQAAVGREDIVCVQSLILLGIYAMFDPSGISLWHVVGFAARVAIALNLHRRVDDSNIPANLAEHRKRVFYSLFNLDRLVAVTLSKPLAISDNDIDVQLPSPMDNDVPFRGRPRIEFTQHIIKLRRLGGIILSTVYSVSGDQNSLPENDRAHIILDLHRRLDGWLSECPISDDTNSEEKAEGSNDDTSTTMIHTSHSWFLLNYHQGLCLLYRPSPLYPTMTNERLNSLHESSSKCVDLYLNLWKENKVSYNLINISMQFLSCISLLYCLCEFDHRNNNRNQGEGEGEWKKQVLNRINQCSILLNTFSQSLPETAKYREIFAKLSNLLLDKYGPSSQEEPSTGIASSLGVDNTSTIGNGNIIPPIPNPTPNPSMNTTDPSSTNTNTNPSGDEHQNTGANENEIAWNAMTQLWYNSGEFIFDERALSTALTSLSNNPFTLQQQQQPQQDIGLDDKDRDLGSARGLWHQLG